MVFETVYQKIRTIAGSMTVANLTSETECKSYLYKTDTFAIKRIKLRGDAWLVVISAANYIYTLQFATISFVI